MEDINSMNFNRQKFFIGLMARLQRFLRPQTPIPGLYLTGQDVCTCGVGGALVSGFLTASTITRSNLLMKALGR